MAVSRSRSSAVRPMPAPASIGVLGLPGAVVPANGMELLQGRGDPRRRIERHDVLDARAWPRRRARRDHRAAGGRANRPVVRRLPPAADPVFDVAITPNRPDCMGVHGIARDLAAAGLGTLKPVGLGPAAGSGRAGGGAKPNSAQAELVEARVPSFASPVEIRTDDPEGCPAFYGRVIPRRDQRRLARMDAGAAEDRQASARFRRWSTSLTT